MIKSSQENIPLNKDFNEDRGQKIGSSNDAEFGLKPKTREHLRQVSAEEQSANEKKKMLL
jgi:hypothetical protein